MEPDQPTGPHSDDDIASVQRQDQGVEAARETAIYLSAFFDTLVARGVHVQVAVSLAQQYLVLIARRES